MCYALNSAVASVSFAYITMTDSQNHTGLARTVYIIYKPYMTVYSVISLPKIPYKHRIYMVLANPIHMI
jgi:hypothetical protein